MSDHEFMTKQAILTEAVTRLANEFGDDPDYIWPEILDTRSLKLELVWRALNDSEIPKILAVVGEQVDVSFFDYPYTRPQLLEAMDRAMNTNAGLANSGVRIVSARVGPKTTPGIEIRISDAPSESPTTDAVSTVRQLATAALSGTGVPLTGVVRGPAPELTSRTNDTGGIAAGAFFKFGSFWSGYQYCSAGFGYKYNGVNRMLTARHCRNSNNTAHWNYYSGDGTTFYSDASRVLDDAGTAIRITNGHGTAYAYYLGRSSSSYMPVKQTVALAEGSYVCTSGGNSGELCNIKVIKLLHRGTDGYGYFNSIIGQQMTNDTAAVCKGDSGGPVITKLSSTRFGAAGIIQAGDFPMDNSNRPALNQADGITCYRQVLFSSVQSLQSNVGGYALTMA